MKKLMKLAPVKTKHNDKQPMGQPCVIKLPKMGRPRVFEEVEDFCTAVQAYFDECVENDSPLYLTEMILHIGLSSRESLDEYGRRPEFSDSVKRAKLYIALSYERCLRGTTPAGAIFALKNFGWTDGKTVKKDEHLLKTQKIGELPPQLQNMSELEIANWIIARIRPYFEEAGIDIDGEIHD